MAKLLLSFSKKKYDQKKKYDPCWTISKNEQFIILIPNCIAKLILCSVNILVIGLFNAHTSCYCHGICCRWRAIWENHHSRAIQWRWGLFWPYIRPIVNPFPRPEPCLTNVMCSLCCKCQQSRYFFQQLISGVSYCHSMVWFCFEKLTSSWIVECKF